MYQKEFDLAHNYLIGQGILDGHWIIQVVPTPQNMLLVVLGTQSLVLLTQDLLKEANVGSDEYLDQVGCVEVVVELFNVVLVASSLHLGNDESLVLFY